MIRRLLTWLRPYAGRSTLSVLLGALTIGSSIALMATSAWLISKSALQPSIAELGVSVVGVRFFGLARAVFRYLERLIAHDTTFRWLADVRVRVYRAIEPLAPARLSALRSGDLLGRVIGDVDALQNLYLRALAPALVALVTGAVLVTLSAAFDGVVALTALAWFGASAALIVTLAAWLGREPGQRLTQERGALNAALVDTLQGLPDLIAYGAAPRQLQALEAQADQLAAHERRFARLDALQAALLIMLPAGAVISVLLLAIPRVEGVYLATLALATTAAYEALLPLGQAALAWGGMRESAVRLFELMDTPPAVTEPAAPISVPATFDITFDQVTFAYTPEQPPVLRDFSVTIGAGERLAIIGESGAGKSTLVSLLARFWEIDGGQISIGGVDVRALRQADARRLISVMSQHTYLFNTTIRENIRLARSEASDAEVEGAARAAHIHEFIRSLPQGYDTLVGENGHKLSGGERQRVALAQALLKDAPILILDEATAHLDAATERDVLEAVLTASTGRTLILLTHNPALLAHVERVLRL